MKKKKSIPPFWLAGTKFFLKKKRSNHVSLWRLDTCQPHIQSRHLKWREWRKRQKKKKPKIKVGHFGIFFSKGSDLKFFLQIGSEKKKILTTSTLTSLSLSSFTLSPIPATTTTGLCHHDHHHRQPKTLQPSLQLYYRRFRSAFSFSIPSS